MPWLPERYGIDRVYQRSFSASLHEDQVERFPGPPGSGESREKLFTVADQFYHIKPQSAEDLSQRVPKGVIVVQR